MKALIIISILIALVSSFSSGYGLRMAQVPNCEIVEIPTYVYSPDRILRYQKQVKMLSALLEECQASREEKARRIMELEKTLSEQYIKIALYEALTTDRVEVESKP